MYGKGKWPQPGGRRAQAVQQEKISHGKSGLAPGQVSQRDGAICALWGVQDKAMAELIQCQWHLCFEHQAGLDYYLSAYKSASLFFSLTQKTSLFLGSFVSHTLEPNLGLLFLTLLQI